MASRIFVHGHRGERIRHAVAALVAAAGVAALVTGSLLGILSSAGAAPAGDSPGNDGFVKIEGSPSTGCPTTSLMSGAASPSSGTTTRRFPTVGSVVTFELQPPTGPQSRTLTVATGDLTPSWTTVITSGPASQLVHSEAYTLAFTGAPHPVQGYHVKISVATTLSQGSDMKYKVFWVGPCGESSSSSSSSEPSSSSSSSESSSSSSSSESSQSSSSSSSSSVLPSSVTKTPVVLPTHVSAGLSASDTSGSSGTGLIVAGAVMVFAAVSILLGGRQRGTRRA